jgi:tetratricopeptide (TPR) repeat protein
MKNKLLFLAITLFAVSSIAKQKEITPPLSPDSDPTSSSTYAVVVGISDYQDASIPDLKFADKDAEAFAAYLRSNAGGNLDNDHLKVLINQQATMAQFGIALDWLMENAKEGDRVIIYFSGHGDVEKRTLTQPGFLLCWDAPARVYISGGAFALPMLQEVISTISIQNKAKVIVITDACRSGKLAGNSIGGSQATASNLAKQYANEIKIMSCQPNEYSIEGEQWGGGRGAFSYHLIDGLYGLADNNKDQFITLQEVGRYLEDHVSTEVAPVSQVPMTVGNRNERLSIVDEEMLASIKSGKLNQTMMLSAVESRGIEDDVLTKLDSSTRKIYTLFKNSLKQKIFLQPDDACADSYYRQLIKIPGLNRLFSTMKRNYAAALQDDAQQALNVMLKSGLTKDLVTGKEVSVVYKNYPAYLERAAELLGPGHYMYKSLQARKFYFKAKMGKTMEEIRRNCFSALQWQPDLPHAYLALIANRGAEQVDSAEYYTRKAMEFSPGWVVPNVALSIFYQFKLNNPVKAKKALQRALQVDSNSLFVWYQFSKFYLWQHDYDQAVNSLTRVVNGSGDGVCFPCAHSDLGTIYYMKHQFDKAEPILKKTIQLDSTFFRAYNNLGTLYYDMRRYAEAEQLYKKGLQLDSTSNELLFNLGKLYLTVGRFAEAETLTRKIIQRDTLFSIAYDQLGDIYIRTQRFQEAEKQINKAIKLDSTNVYFYNDLGILYLNTQNYAKAEQQFKKVIQLDSTKSEAHYNLACMESKQGKTDNAFVTLERALHYGYGAYDDMQQDSDLVPLRLRKEQWNSLMKKYFPNK